MLWPTSTLGGPNPCASTSYTRALVKKSCNTITLLPICKGCGWKYDLEANEHPDLEPGRHHHRAPRHGAWGEPALLLARSP